jgi:translation elongation factor P/translation initiation factor 5A
MISSYFIDVIGGLYEIGEMITIKTAKASTKREIKIIDQSNNKVRKTYLQNI